EFFNEPPTLTEVAQAMGSSHQNVKQIALKLHQKGFLEMVKDEKDRRATRLRLTEKCYAFWQNRENEDLRFFNMLYEDFSETELNGLYDGLNKLLKKIEKI
ncbi:MAG: winged helix DNA-binding protein, partial [Bacillota bacterium]|nr:winged helix DNA-binding protein [Bacillota bacterium]